MGVANIIKCLRILNTWKPFLTKCCMTYKGRVGEAEKGEEWEEINIEHT